MNNTTNNTSIEPKSPAPNYERVRVVFGSEEKATLQFSGHCEGMGIVMDNNGTKVIEGGTERNMSNGTKVIVGGSERAGAVIPTSYSSFMDGIEAKLEAVVERKTAPLELEVRRLKMRVESLQDYVREADQDLQEERAKNQKLQTRAENLELEREEFERIDQMEEVVEAYCSICRFKPKDSFLRPCLHVFCSGCIKKFTRDGQKKCPFCRGDYDEVTPFFN